MAKPNITIKVTTVSLIAMLESVANVQVGVRAVRGCELMRNSFEMLKLIL